MKMMILASLVLNILVLIPVCTGLLRDASWATQSYGPATPARGILLSVYLSILIISVGLLFFQDPKLVLALLTVQIVYKVITPFAVGLSNPVVISNLGISAVHAVTVALIILHMRSG